MKPLYALFTSIVLAVIGQIIMKSAMLKIGGIDLHWNNIGSTLWKIFSHSSVFLGLLFFGASVFLWLVALSKIKLSVAYPMVAITYVVIPILSYFLFKESLNPVKVIALSIIIFGVILLSKFP
ncbi:MAG: EamA family transporter [Candidatus Omnitrophica bacterium]|nr:EamA family transporter [Candidatus Omnitrophota bacterium]